VRTVPPGFPPGSDVANLSVLGFNPETFYTGRAPLEAAAMGVEMGPGDVAYRCNLVTVKDGVMEDYSAGHISSEEAAQLIEALNDALGDEEFSFYPGVSYRHLLLWRGGRDILETTPPHDISGRKIQEYLPRGEGARRLLELMEASREILARHPVNMRRVEEGKKPATMIWLWGQGRRPRLPAFRDVYGLEGAVISAVDLMRGLAVLLGVEWAVGLAAAGLLPGLRRASGCCHSWPWGSRRHSLYDTCLPSCLASCSGCCGPGLCLAVEPGGEDIRQAGVGDGEIQSS